MKTIVLFSGILFLCFNASAESFRVNNQGFGAPFTQINAAIAAADIGDTIYVEPSPTQYAGFTVNKGVVVIGVGYFLAENNIPGVTPLAATTGSASISAANAKILGLFVNGSISIQAANVTIQRCRVTSGITFSTNAQNATVIQCFIGSVINATIGGGHLVSNNYIQVGFSGSAPTVVTQNTINGSGSNFSYAPGNSTVSNNIYYNFNFSQPALPANTVFLNNVGTVTNLPNTNDNINGATQVNLFVGPNIVTPVDNALILAEGSPAAGAGVSGEDAGMFGGVAPYRLSGLPPIPRITSVLAPNVVGVNQPFNVTINAQSVE